MLGSKSVADEHSEHGGMKVLRLYADALGESRFQTTTMPMALKEFAPPAARILNDYHTHTLSLGRN